jgi:hypothetical protein
MIVRALSLLLSVVAMAQPLAASAQAPSKNSDWWSLKPIRAIAPPALKLSTVKPRAGVNLQSWFQNPIDRFVLDKMLSKGLSPSAPADRRTLIRRATFDLHGLPPTPDEIDNFVKDRSPNAWSKVIDRLLASPRYGERWARHWLDVVHFADTHGYDKDKRRDAAWPYRDYVIRSLNEDKPFSRFLKEQIAGDALYPDNPDAVIATGFVAAGPWDFVGQVELREGTVEKEKTRVLDRDDMVANAMSTFASVTIHCARCHDHKFDPIPQRDYYRLQAVFSGVERGERGYSDLANASKRRELTDSRTGLVAKRRAIMSSIAGIRTPEIDRIDTDLRIMKEALVEPTPLPGILPPKASPSNGYHSGIEAQPDVTKWVQIDLGSELPIDEVVLIPARPTDFKDTPGFGFPVRFQVELSTPTTKSTISDQTATDFPNPGNTPYVAHGKGKATRYVRITATRLWKRTDDYVFALGEVHIISRGVDVAAGKTVTALDTIEAGRWSTRFLNDGFDSRKALPDMSIPRIVESELRKWEIGKQIALKEEERRRLVDAAIDPATRQSLQDVEAAITKLDADLRALPEEKKVYAVVPRAPRPIWLLKRGDVEQHGDEVTPGALTCVQGMNADLQVRSGSTEGARRAALADWLADPKNPLTWRSIVNRVWQYHFGKGIVDTPNDFGRNGALPSHPELLDWLAENFRSRMQEGKKTTTATTQQKYRNGEIQKDGLDKRDNRQSAIDNKESLKSLHRLIMLSQTYQQSSASDPALAKIDGDNRYLWRANRMRLDAESVRDSVLAVSGAMDWMMGGPGYEPFRFKDDHSPIYDHSDLARINDPKTWRRTIYRFTVRSVPSPFLESLDCADPNVNTPVRNTTLTALQALSLLNDPFMVRQAELLAARVCQKKQSLQAQVHEAFRLTIGRQLLPGEEVKLTEYAGKHGIANACRLLFNMNEFVFVD